VTKQINLPEANGEIKVLLVVESGSRRLGILIS
jgi:hypothetical protein